MKVTLKGNWFTKGRMLMAGQEIEVGKDCSEAAYKRYSGQDVEVKTSAKPSDATEAEAVEKPVKKKKRAYKKKTD